MRRECRQLRFRRSSEADAPTGAVRDEGLRADPLREPAADEPPEHFELPGAVLTLAEPHREVRVGFTFGIDVRNAPLVASDGDGSGQPVEAQFAGGGGESAA